MHRVKLLVSLALALILVGCDGADAQGPGTPKPVLQATVGIHHFEAQAPFGMYALVSLDIEVGAPDVSVSLAGPPGWNSNRPYNMTGFGPGVREVFVPYAPLDGEYSVTATIGDDEHVVTRHVDTSQRLPVITGLAAAVRADGIAVSWNPVPGAAAYVVELRGPGTPIGPMLVARTQTVGLTLPIARSEIDEGRLGEYQIQVLASTHDPEATVIDYGTQIVKVAAVLALDEAEAE